MNVKAVIGLLVVGAAALTYSSGRGRGRRRRSTLKGLGSPPEEHAAQRDFFLKAAERQVAAAEALIVEAAAAWQGVGEKHSYIAPKWRRPTAGKACERAAKMLMEGVGNIGAAEAEDRGAGDAQSQRLIEAVGAVKGVRSMFTEVCRVGNDYTGPAAPARGFNGLGSPGVKHATNYPRYLSEAEQQLVRAEHAVVDSKVARRAKKDADARQHCGVAMNAIRLAAYRLGRAASEHDGAGDLAPENLHTGILLRDLAEVTDAALQACAPRVPAPTGTRMAVRAVSGLGLDPAQHGINRSTHSVQAGFKIKDAVKAARNGWCGSAVKALREAEYEAGQTTAHSKSIIGEAGVMQRRKAQATRVAVNRAAKIVAEACTFHRKRAKAVSRRQGSLPF